MTHVLMNSGVWVDDDITASVSGVKTEDLQ